MLLHPARPWDLRPVDADDPPVPDPDQWPSVGVVVPARNEADLIGPTLGALDQQDYPGEMSVVVIEHDMSFVRRLGCRTIVMHQGRLIADGSFETVSQDERVRDAYLGRA